MNSGERFVQTLRKVGYPKAPQLDGDDFDWLFETPDAKSFLEWFCTNVSEQNLVSDEKQAAFNDLKESGKAILDEKSLDEVLKSCTPSNPKMGELENVAIEKLEEDLESLRKLRNVHLKRRNKLQMMASANSHRSLKLKDIEEADAKKLKEILSSLQVINNKLNHELKNIVDGVQKLVSFYTIPEAGLEPSSPVFLSQVLLEKYLSCQEQSSAALTSFIKEHFVEGSTNVTPPTEKKFQDLKLGSQEEPDDKHKEMMKLNLAYISAKHKLIQAKAKKVSLKAGLQWAQDQASAVLSKPANTENLQARILSIKEDTSKIQDQIEVISRETLPNLVQESAQLLNIPIVKGDCDLHMARLNLYAHRQDIVCNHLLKHKASFDLLQMGYELELTKHHEVYCQLTTMIENIKQSANNLDHRLLMMSDARLLASSKPISNIESKDSSSHRLYQIVDEDQTQKLFRTYNGLESVVQKLTQDITAVKDQLAASEQEQALFVSTREADLKALRVFMYPKGKELLLNTPELASHFQLLDSQLNTLNHILSDVLADVKIKRNVLQSDQRNQIEKQLYVYFFQNEQHLRDLVKNLESQTDIHSST
ncbi:HAUS augmin-like complex subunit 3 [Pelodytes ibericus]